MKAPRLPGFIAYAAVALWFLMTVMTPVSARAQDAPSSVIARIEAALIARGAPANGEIILDAPGAAASLAGGSAFVESVRFNPASGRFLVRMRSRAGASVIPVSGRIAAAARLPVLAAALERGEIVGEDDVVFIERADVKPSLFIRSANDLVGMEARRPLAAGAPLRPSDVAAPVLVRKGALVTIHFERGGLRIADQGVAQRSGAKGDVISIENARSGRSVKAVVTGRNAARVIGASASIQPQGD